jgi:dihydrofolate reductase
MTEIERAFDGDVVFPPFDRTKWRERVRESHRAQSPQDLDYAFVTYERAY